MATTILRKTAPQFRPGGAIPFLGQCHNPPESPTPFVGQGGPMGPEPTDANALAQFLQIQANQPTEQEELMTMFYKEYLLFRDGWDEDSEKEIEESLVHCAMTPTWQSQFLPAFVELLKREQFIKIMECLDKDKNLRIQPRLQSRGFDLVSKQAGPHRYRGPAPEAVAGDRQEEA